MPIPAFQDVLADPVFSTASVEQQREIHANYWKAFDDENPQIVEELKNTPEGEPVSPDAAYASNIRQTSGMILDTREQLKDADPVQTKALNHQWDTLNTSLQLNVADRLGSFKTAEERQAFVDENQKKLAAQQIEVDAATDDFNISEVINKSKSYARDQILTTFSERGYYPSLTAAFASAKGNELVKEDGKWKTPFMQPGAPEGANMLERNAANLGSLVASAASRMGLQSERFDLTLQGIQEKSGLDDEQFKQAWSDIGNNLRDWEPEEKSRVNSDGQLVLNPASSELLDTESANALIEASGASWYGKRAAKKRAVGLGVEQAASKLESYEAASQVLQLRSDGELSSGVNDKALSVSPLISPSQWATEQGRDDLGTPAFIKAYEDEVVDKQGTGSKWMRGITTDLILGLNQLANTGTGLAGAAGSDKAAELAAQGSEAGSIIGQGKFDTGLTGQVVQQVPSLAAQVVSAQITAGASLTLLGQTAAAKAVTTMGVLTTAGAQSAGMTYAQQRADGDSHELAQRKSLDSGIATSLITGGFQALGSTKLLKGLGGVEGSLVNATVGDLVGATGTAVARTGVQKFTRIALGTVGEFGEGYTDTITNAFLTADKDTNLATAWKDAWKSGFVEAVLGAGVTSVETLLPRDTPTAEQTDDELRDTARNINPGAPDIEPLTEESLPEAPTEGGTDAAPSEPDVAPKITRADLINEIATERGRLERLGDRQIQGPDGKLIDNPDQRILTTDERVALEALKGTPEEVAKAFGIEIVEDTPTDAPTSELDLTTPTPPTNEIRETEADIEAEAEAEGQGQVIEEPSPLEGAGEVALPTTAKKPIDDATQAATVTPVSKETKKISDTELPDPAKETPAAVPPKLAEYRKTLSDLGEGRTQLENALKIAKTQDADTAAETLKPFVTGAARGFKTRSIAHVTERIASIRRQESSIQEKINRDFPEKSAVTIEDKAATDEFFSAMLGGSKPSLEDIQTALTGAYPFKRVTNAKEQAAFISKAKIALKPLGIAPDMVDIAVEAIRARKAQTSGGKEFFVSDAEIARQLEADGRAAPATPPSPTTGQPTESLPTDQPTSGDVGTVADTNPVETPADPVAAEKTGDILGDKKTPSLKGAKVVTPPTEGGTVNGKFYSTQRLYMDALRAKYNMPEYEPSHTTNAGDVEIALQRLEATRKFEEEDGPAPKHNTGQDLVHELSSSTRAANSVENALLLHEVQRLDKALQKANRDAEANPALVGKAETAWADLALTADVTSRQGTLAGRALQAFKKVMADQFSVSNLAKQATTWKKAADPAAKLDDKDRALIKKTAEDAEAKFKDRDGKVLAEEHDTMDKEALAIHDKLLKNELSGEEAAARFAAQAKVIDDLQSELGEARVENEEKSAAIAALVTIREAVKKTPQAVSAAFSKQADAARARMLARRRSGQLSSTPLPDAVDASIIGADYILKGATSLAKFSAKMLAEFKDFTKAQLASIYKQSKALVGQSSKSKETRSPEEILAGIDSNKALRQKDVYNMFVGYLRSGMRGHKKIIEQITSDLTSVYSKITYDDVAKAFTNYGKFTEPSKEAIATMAREGRQLVLKETQLSELKAKGEIERTGSQRGEMTPETAKAISDLDAEIEATYKRLRITRVSEKALKSPLASIKTRMRNDIRDRKAALAAGRKLVNKDNPPEGDTESKELAEELKEVRDTYNYVFRTGDEVTEQQRVTRVMAHLDKQTTKANAMLANGILKSNPKKTTAETNADILAAKARLQEIHEDRISALKALNPTKSRTELAYDAALKANRAGLEADKKTVRTGILPATKAKAKLYTVEGELKTVLEERAPFAALVAELKKAARKDAGVTSKEIAKALKDAKASVAALDKRIAKIQAGVATVREARVDRFKGVPDVVAIRKERDARQKTVAALERQQRSTTPPTPAEVDAALARFSDSEARLEARIAQLEAGRLPAAKAPSLLSQIPSIAAAKARIKTRLAVESSMKAALDTEGLDKRRIRAAEARQASYAKRIAEKDYSATVKPDRKLSEAAEKAIFEADKVMAEWQKQRAAYEFAQKRWAVRTFDHTWNTASGFMQLGLVGDLLLGRQGKTFIASSIVPRFGDAYRALNSGGVDSAFKAMFQGYFDVGGAVHKAWKSAMTGDDSHAYTVYKDLEESDFNQMLKREAGRGIHLVNLLNERMLVVEGAPEFKALEKLANLEVPGTNLKARLVTDVFTFLGRIERFGVTFLNLGRYAVAETYHTELTKGGKPLTKIELNGIIANSEIFTGRADLTKGSDVEGSVRTANKYMFVSFRWTYAELQRQSIIIPLYKAGSPRAAAVVFRQLYIRTVIGRALIDVLFGMFRPEDEDDKDRFKAFSVGYDPYDNKNFGRINVYGRKTDPTLGSGALFSLIFQVAKGKTYVRGKLRDDVSAVNILKDKAHRLVIKNNNMLTSKVFSQMFGRDFAGTRLSLTDKEGLSNSFKMWTTQIAVNDGINIFQQYGPEGFGIWAQMMAGDNEAGEYFKNDFEVMLEEKAAKKKPLAPFPR